jgi:hypothetical protein
VASILRAREVGFFSQIKSRGEPFVDRVIAACSFCIHPKPLQIMVRKGIVPPHRIGKLWKFRFIRLVHCTVYSGTASRMPRWASQDPNQGLLPRTCVSYPTFPTQAPKSER